MPKTIKVYITVTIVIFIALFLFLNIPNQNSIEKVNKKDSLAKKVNPIQPEINTTFPTLDVNLTDDNNSELDSHFIKVKYHKDEITVYKETPYLNGLKDGVEKEYNENGVLAQERSFSKGILNGNSVSYFQNGDISNIVPYINGLKEGTAEIYTTSEMEVSTNRYLVKKIQYQRDLKNGYEIEYKIENHNTFLFKKVHYTDGVKDKTALVYDSLGRVLISTTFDANNNQKTMILYDTNEVPIVTTTYLGKNKILSQIGFNPKTKKYFEINWKYSSDNTQITKRGLRAQGLIKSGSDDVIMTEEGIKEYLRDIQRYFKKRLQ